MAVTITEKGFLEFYPDPRIPTIPAFNLADPTTWRPVFAIYPNGQIRALPYHRDNPIPSKQAQNAPRTNRPPSIAQQKRLLHTSALEFFHSLLDTSPSLLPENAPTRVGYIQRHGQPTGYAVIASSVTPESLFAYMQEGASESERRQWVKDQRKRNALTEEAQTMPAELFQQKLVPLFPVGLCPNTPAMAMQENATTPDFVGVVVVFRDGLLDIPKRT